MPRHLGTLATAAGLLLAGGWEAFQRTHNDGAAALFLSAGFIVLGCWLALEVLATRDRHQSDDSGNVPRDR